MTPEQKVRQDYFKLELILQMFNYLCDSNVENYDS